MSFNDAFSSETIPFITGLDGQVLTWDQATQQWVAGPGVESIITSVSTSNGIIGDGTDTNPVRLNSNITVQNLYVEKTASIAHIDFIFQQSLIVGDKYITLMSGANNHSLMDGSGLLWGSGSTDETTGEQESVAHIVYRNNTKNQLEVFPGLFVSGSLTSSLGINVQDASIIDVSSSNAALRITQRGLGNVILVEDSENPDLDPFVINKDGKVGIGLTSPISNLQVVGSVIQGLSAQTEIGAGAHAEGFNTLAFGEYSHAEGDTTEAYGPGSHAEGIFTEASGVASHAEGLRTISGPYSHAEGDTTFADGIGAHAEGGMTFAKGTYTHAEGYLTTASFLGAHSEGYRTIASGNYVHSEGRDTIGQGYASHVEGFRTLTSASYAHAEGYLTTASAEAAHSEGQYTIARANYSHAEGISTIASGAGSHAEGRNTIAVSIGSHAEGYYTVASGGYSKTEGFYNLASGYGSHAEGAYTTASGESSHVEGQYSLAIGNHSHAEGIRSVASGAGSHAEGTNTLALGTRTHTEGYFTTASGQYSHAEGLGSITYGSFSFANGLNNITTASFQTVVGTCNIPNDKALFVVGNGTYSINLSSEPYIPTNVTRSNIFEVLQDSINVSSSLRITGGLQLPIKKVTTNYLFTTGSDYTVLFNGSNLTATLPQASLASGFIFNAKNLSDTPLFITASSGKIDDKINGFSFNTKYVSYTFQSDGNDWYII